MGFHCSSHGYKVGHHLAIDEPVNRIKQEDTGGNEGALELINEVIVPSYSTGATVGNLIGRLCGFHVALCLETNPECLHCLEKNGTTGRTDGVFLLADNEDNNGDEKEAERKEICSPEINLEFQPDSCDGGKRSNVDTPVENVVQTLNGDIRVNDNSFATLQCLYT